MKVLKEPLTFQNSCYPKFFASRATKRFAQFLTLSAFLSGAVDLSQGSTAEVARLRLDAAQMIGPLSGQAPGAEKDNADLVKLGERLYFEKRLSANNSISCNSCHRVDQNRGGVDNEATSPGAFGKRGGRNSPTVLNAAFQSAQFWDGRAENLEAQAKGPILNPIEMAMSADNEVISRLRGLTEYEELFAKAFPGRENNINYDNVARAIAAFERTLITRDRFDDFLKGDDQALAPTELSGLKLFLETGCTACHSGPTLGGSQFQKIGLIHKYETPDIGRYEATKNEEDKYKFKVPMLRNIAITGPYFHDGKLKTLEETVKTMAWLQLDKQLPDEQIRDLTAFLNTLTDKPRARK